MTNQLIHETSPYLLQHAHNPVNWYSWNDSALQRARTEQKPIFLSIGYAACHWCHVMEQESFEDTSIAELLNLHFISIKVDREERPDLDNIYMSAVVAMTGRGGWPMTVFLTPDLEPFYGGTYFPPTRRYGMPAFAEVLLGIALAWKEDRTNLLLSAKQLSKHLQTQSQWKFSPAAPVSPSQALNQATRQLTQTINPQTGTWGNAPLFPQPMTIEFLLQQATRGNQIALQCAETALQAMQRGGMYDILGGGFHRYSTDDQWLVPHFEKMLYDNALLARTYLHAYQQTSNPLYRDTCQATLDFILREMRSPEGGFYSSLDADSPEGEGFYYTWEENELRSALPQEEFSALITAFFLSNRPAFEGRHILQWRQSPLPRDQWPPTLQKALQRLLLLRQSRTPPSTDDKILTAWNALTIQTLAQAGQALSNPHYLNAAQQALTFLVTNLHPQDRLLRSWRAQQAHIDAYLEDYAALVLASLSVYQADFNPKWYQSAHSLTEEMINLYRDPQGGFFDVRADAPNLLLHPKEIYDNATPSGNALATLALLTLQAYGENPSVSPEELLQTLQSAIASHPLAFGCWLQALDWLAGPVKQIALLWPSNDPPPKKILSAIHSPYRPRTILAASSNSSEMLPPILHERPLHKQNPTLYICQDFTCQMPVSEWPTIVSTLNAKNLPTRD